MIMASRGGIPSDESGGELYIYAHHQTQATETTICDVGCSDNSPAACTDRKGGASCDGACSAFTTLNATRKEQIYWD